MREITDPHVGLAGSIFVVCTAPKVHDDLSGTVHCAASQRLGHVPVTLVLIAFWTSFFNLTHPPLLFLEGNNTMKRPDCGLKLCTAS